MLFCFLVPLFESMKLTLRELLSQKPERINTDLSVIGESSAALNAAKLPGVFQSADVARQQTQFHPVGRTLWQISACNTSPSLNDMIRSRCCQK